MKTSWHTHHRSKPKLPNISKKDIKRDVTAIIWSLKLHNVRRYFHQRFWERETIDAEYASKVEPSPKLESVSEHTWHVTDTVLMLGPHFPEVDIGHAVQLATLHDKLEILTGDKTPLGRDGTGSKTHAFNLDARQLKEQNEQHALFQYLQKLSPKLRASQQKLFMEVFEGLSAESCFVRSIDKFQSLVFVHCKKDGLIDDKHISFTLRYAERAVDFFPPIIMHYKYLRSVFLRRIAARRNMSLAALEKRLQDNQLPLL